MELSHHSVLRVENLVKVLVPEQVEYHRPKVVNNCLSEDSHQSVLS